MARFCLQDLLALRTQVGGQVNVDTAVLTKSRQHYENVANKNRKKAWFPTKGSSVFCPKCVDCCPLPSKSSHYKKKKKIGCKIYGPWVGPVGET